MLATLTSQGFLHPPQLHRRPICRELDVVQIRCNNRTRRKPQLNALICRAGSSCCPQLGFGPFGGKAQRGPFWGWGHLTLHPKKRGFVAASSPSVWYSSVILGWSQHVVWAWWLGGGKETWRQAGKSLPATCPPSGRPEPHPCGAAHSLDVVGHFVGGDGSLPGHLDRGCEERSRGQKPPVALSNFPSPRAAGNASTALGWRSRAAGTPGPTNPAPGALPFPALPTLSPRLALSQGHPAAAASIAAAVPEHRAPPRALPQLVGGQAARRQC